MSNLTTTTNLVDATGLNIFFDLLYTKYLSLIATCVQLELGKELYPTADKTKLSGIESGAQVNVIESITINNGSALSITNKNVDISIPTNNSQLSNGAGYAIAANLATVATSGSYSDLSNVPTNLNQFENGPGYLTQHQDISGKANSADLATVATSGLYSDLSGVPTKLSQFTNDPGYLTSHQSLSGYATETWVSNKFDDMLGINADGISALKTALSDDDKTTGILTAIAGKVDKESGKRLMTDAEGTKLSGIETGAQVHKAPTTAEVKSALGTGSGTTKYLREDGSWATPPNDNTWPTALSQLSNDVGYITSYTNTVTSINGKTGAIAAGDIAAVLTAAGYALTDTDTNTWRPLGTTADTACAGNDSRLSDARPASDVYSWAKASSKPSYSYSEISNTPSSLPASDVYSWAKASSKPSYSYSEISGRPTKLSDLSNDVGYITSYTDTNTWRPITNTYTGSDLSTSVSQYGTNALYNALVNGYASSAGNADTLDGYHYNNLPYLTSHQDISGKVDKVSGSRPGVTKLYRSDSDDAYNVQTDWTGSYWRLRGFYGDSYHAGCQVAYAESSGYASSAGSAPASDVYSWAKASSKPSYSWSEISSRPTALSSFTNDSGYITSSGSCSYASSAGSAPASDVYSWAKASSKPSYTLAEVGASMSAVSISSNTSSSCSITGSGNSGKSLTIVYVNAGSSDLTVTVPTTYKTPKNAAIEVKCPGSGYCEVNYINIGGTIYARGA